MKMFSLKNRPINRKNPKNRKWFGFLISLALVATFVCTSTKEVRADINGNESAVIGAASSTFYYNGAYYRVKSEYINQLINALDTQYDLSPESASACIDYIYNNVAAGVSGGYLYKVEEKKEPEKKEEPAVPEKKPADIEKVPATVDPSKDRIVEIDPNKPKKTKEELLKETSNLAADMGLNVSYDSSKDGVTITDKSGNMLVSTKNAVKNTGYRLNSLVYLFVSLVACAVIALVFAWKYGLLTAGEEDMA